jgi:AmmeMemoRadiSam system protein B
MAATSLQPAVAGLWYPDDPGRLTAEVDRMLARAASGKEVSTRAVRGVVAPHAGLRFSGPVAAHAFTGCAGTDARRVVLVGPSHHHAFSGLAVPRATAFSTPLGPVEIDGAALERLARHPEVRRDDGPFEPEHALEIELPFLHRVLEPSWTVVPILTGIDVVGRRADALARAIVDAVGNDALWVASSDFTHHGPRFGYRPFRDRIPERIRELDRSVLDAAERRDVPGFETVLDETRATVCGRHAIGLMLRALPRGVCGRTAAYDTSGAITGDWTDSVSYAAVRYGESGS